MLARLLPLAWPEALRQGCSASDAAHSPAGGSLTAFCAQAGLQLLEKPGCRLCLSLLACLRRTTTGEIILSIAKCVMGQGVCPFVTPCPDPALPSQAAPLEFSTFSLQLHSSKHAKLVCRWTPLVQPWQGTAMVA